MRLSIKVDYETDADDGYPVQTILYGYVRIPEICIGQIEVSNSGEWDWVKDDDQDPLVTKFIEDMTQGQYAVFSAEITRQNQEYILNPY